MYTSSSNISKYYDLNTVPLFVKPGTIIQNIHLEMGKTTGNTNRAFNILFSIFFWDNIYNDEIEDVFYFKFQCAPIDLGYDEFYEKRKS